MPSCLAINLSAGCLGIFPVLFLVWKVMKLGERWPSSQVYIVGYLKQSIPFSPIPHHHIWLQSRCRSCRSLCWRAWSRASRPRRSSVLVVVLTWAVCSRRISTWLACFMRTMTNKKLHRTDFLAGSFFDIRLEVHSPVNGSEARVGEPDPNFTFTIAKKGEQPVAATEFFDIAEPKLERWDFKWFEGNQSLR